MEELPAKSHPTLNSSSRTSLQPDTCVCFDDRTPTKRGRFIITATRKCTITTTTQMHDHGNRAGARPQRTRKLRRRCTTTAEAQMDHGESAGARPRRRRR